MWHAVRNPSNPEAAGVGPFPALCPDAAAQVDPLALHPSGRELLETYRSLQLVEKEVLQVRVQDGIACAEHAVGYGDCLAAASPVGLTDRFCLGQA